MRTIDITVSQLCEEIDMLNEEVRYWKEKYNNEVEERNHEWLERKNQIDKDIANTLMLALSVRDNGNGDLIIPASDRKELAKNWR